MHLLSACLFDLDGVIVDTARYHFMAWRRMANALGTDFTEHDNEQLKGVSRIDSLELILRWGGLTLSEQDKAYWLRQKNEWYLEYVRAMQPSEVLPGSRELLEALREAGVRIALGSASKNAVMILERTRLLPLFDAVIDGNHTQHSKPHPEVFLLGAQALGVSPAQSVVFEDSIKGIEAALTGGFKVVGVGEPATLQRAHLVVPSLARLTLPLLLQHLEANVA